MIPPILHDRAEVVFEEAIRSPEACRQTVRGILGVLTRYDLPTGVRCERSWILILPKKLESPNKTIWRHWRALGRERKHWEALLWVAVATIEQCASAVAVRELGRAPACQEPMTLAVFRFVKSPREFIRDDDNLAFSVKHANDSLKALRLVKDDNRAWLSVALPMQDVSPLGVPVTVFVLQPAAAGLPRSA